MGRRTRAVEPDAEVEEGPFADREDGDTVFLRGEGGSVQAYDLPLSEPLSDQVAAGRLVEVEDPDAEPAKPKRSRRTTSEKAPEPTADEKAEAEALQALDDAGLGGLTAEDIEALAAPAGADTPKGS